MIQNKICNATNGRLPGGRDTEGNLRRFTVVVCCEKRSSSVSRCHYACFCLVSLGKHIYLNSALIHFWWNQYAWYRKGIWWLGGAGVRVWTLKEGKNMCHTYTHYLTWQRSILTTWTGLQNAGSHWGAWSVKMQGNCWLWCHVYMISKLLIQKYIHVCHPDNWNTHNHQSTESPQNTQTHTVHWNAQNSQPIETP